jgi:DNA polymerase-3 subunit alpha
MFKVFLEEQTVPLHDIMPDHHGKQVSVGGTITEVREINTKNGQRMAFVKIEDHFSEIELILFPSSYQQTVGLWNRDTIVLIRGKVNSKDRDGNLGDEVKIMVDDAREVTEEQAKAYEGTGKKKKTPKAKKQPAKKQKPEDNETVQKPERLYVRLEDSNDQDTLLKLKQTIDSNSGETEVVLVVGADDSKQAIKLPGGIDRSGGGLAKLQTLFGPENLVIK